MSPRQEKEYDDAAVAAAVAAAAAAAAAQEELVAPEEEEVAADGAAGERRTSRKKRPSKKAKKERREAPKVFEDSGLTEAERRALRRDQRGLQSVIGAASSARDLSQHRDANNALFKRVAYTREAVLDAENNLLVASKLAEQAERLVQVPSYDPVKLVQKLRRHCGRGTGSSGALAFQWRELGRQAGVCFNSVPSRVSFWAGPLDAAAAAAADDSQQAKKPRAPRQKADDAVKNAATVELKEVQENGELDGGDKSNRLSACERALKKMKDVLKTKSDKGQEICGLKFLLNPNSFTQSVENVFNYSFLVKRGEGAIGVGAVAGLRDSGGRSLPKGLYVGRRRCAEGDMQARQSVVALTIRDWRRLVDAHRIREGDLPHRPPPAKRAKTVAATAAEE